MIDTIDLGLLYQFESIILCVEKLGFFKIQSNVYQLYWVKQRNVVCIKLTKMNDKKLFDIREKLLRNESINAVFFFLYIAFIASMNLVPVQYV